MQFNHPSSNRFVPQDRLKLPSLFAIAIAIFIADPAYSQSTSDADDGRARLLNVVPADPAETSAAAAIADLAAQAQPEAEVESTSDEAAVEQFELEANAQTADGAATAQEAKAEPANPINPSESSDAAVQIGEEPATDVAVTKAEPVENDPLLAALAKVHSPAELADNLIAAGYEVEVVHIGQTNSTFLVKKSATSTGVLLLIDGRNGKVLSHRVAEATENSHSNGHPEHRHSPRYNSYFQPRVDYNAGAGYGYIPPVDHGYAGRHSGY